MGKLTDRTVKALSAGAHGDGGGLYLQVAEGGSRSWLFRYKVGTKTTWLGLGGYPVVGLAEARDAALDARRRVRKGGDPLADKRAAKADKTAQAGQTFEAVADRYIAAHRAGWRNVKHGEQWRATLAGYAYPVIGQKPVQAISVVEVLAILEPIWTAKPETASRVRGRVEAVLDYATARGLRTGDNPARWRGHMDHLLPARAKVATVKHHPALPYAQLPPVMAKLAAAGSMGALALRFTVLTAARSGEARGARWNELDLAARVWTIPGDRMKAGLPHRVPLSAAALGVLETMEPSKAALDSLVFPGGRAGKPLSDVAVSKALAAAADGVTVHGMRSTFRDWSAEQTNYPREVAEAALAHMNRDRVEAAYRRSDLFEQRARLMREWGEYCTRPAGDTAAATPIRR